MWTSWSYYGELPDSSKARCEEVFTYGIHGESRGGDGHLCGHAWTGARGLRHDGSWCFGFSMWLWTHEEVHQSPSRSWISFAPFGISQGASQVSFRRWWWELEQLVNPTSDVHQGPVRQGTGLLATWGDTYMLCGRPIIEALGIDIGFSKRRYRFDEGHWQDALLGLHGEYLLPMTTDYDSRLLNGLPSFDLRVDAEDETETTTFGIHQFDLEEHVFWQEEATPPLAVKPTTGEKAEERPLWHNFLKTAELTLSGLEQEFQAYVTRNVHEHKRKVLWEVYTGKARVAQLAEAQGMSVEVFGPETGWNFDVLSHRNAFLKRLEQEFPDEVFFAPTCGPWSAMQNINARIRSNNVGSYRIIENGITEHTFSLCARAISHSSSRVAMHTLNNLPMPSLGRRRHSETYLVWKLPSINAAMDVSALMQTALNYLWGSLQPSWPPRSWCLTPCACVAMEVMNIVPWKDLHQASDVARATWRTTSPHLPQSLQVLWWWMKHHPLGSSLAPSMRTSSLADLWWSCWRRIVRRRCVQSNGCTATCGIPASRLWWNFLSRVELRWSRWLVNFIVWLVLVTRNRMDLPRFLSPMLRSSIRCYRPTSCSSSWTTRTWYLFSASLIWPHDIKQQPVSTANAPWTLCRA